MNPRDEKEKQIVISINYVETELVFKTRTTRFIFSSMNNANALLYYYFLHIFVDINDRLTNFQKLLKGNSGHINN